MEPIITYLKKNFVTKDKKEAGRLWCKATWYFSYDDKVNLQGISFPLLRSINKREVEEIFKEIHKGMCGNDNGRKSLAQKAMQQDYGPVW